MVTTRQEDSLLVVVEATIRQHDMLDEADTVVVGVSGGPDSTALLHTLVRLSPRWSLQLVVAHLNHKLRGSAADQDAVFVAGLAASLGIPCRIRSEDVLKFASEQRLSIQEAGRTIRYGFYNEVASEHSAGKIAVGHHAGDNAESVLIHLFRGTGPLGLSGIAPVRGERIIRPLMGVTRRQILDFLDQEGFEYVKDRSNADLKYLRNRVRHELLPHLREHYNPNIVFALNRLSSILRDEEDFWNQEVRKAFEGPLLVQKPDCISLSIPKLLHLHPALLRRVLREALSSLTGNLRRMGHAHVEAVSRLIASPSPTGHLDLPSGVKVVRAREEVNFSFGEPEEPASFEYEIPRIGTTMIREIGVALRLSECQRTEISDPKACTEVTALFDRAAVTFPMKVRSLKPGDRFRPLGMAGSQKVKTFFINQKVPRSHRKRCPILMSGGRIIWVGGFRIDNSVKITEQTKVVLKAEFLPP